MSALPARRNPFAVQRLDALRYRFADGGWSDLIARLERLGLRGAIIGPEGSGKTALLHELLARLREQGQPAALITLRRESRSPSSLAAAFLCSRSRRELIAIDGAEQLGAAGWQAVKLASLVFRGLIITSHTPGRLPTLQQCATSPALLRDLIAELRPEAPVSENFATGLFERHGGNIRSALLECYALAADSRLS